MRIKIIDLLGLTPQNLATISNYARHWPIQTSLF
jgi:hypothetical protein